MKTSKNSACILLRIKRLTNLTGSRLRCRWFSENEENPFPSCNVSGKDKSGTLLTHLFTTNCWRLILGSCPSVSFFTFAIVRYILKVLLSLTSIRRWLSSNVIRENLRKKKTKILKRSARVIEYS